MGISTNYYTIYGTRIEWNDEFSEAYEEAYDDTDTPFVLLDSMCCEYIILGDILFDSGDLRWGEPNDVCVEIDIHKLGELELEYRKQFIAKFPRFESLMYAPFKLMTFVHYS